MGSVPGLEGSLGGGNGNPLQYSCLENSMDRRAWQVTIHGVGKSWIGLSMHARVSLLGKRIVCVCECILFIWKKKYERTCQISITLSLSFIHIHKIEINIHLNSENDIANSWLNKFKLCCFLKTVTHKILFLLSNFRIYLNSFISLKENSVGCI